MSNPAPVEQEPETVPIDGWFALLTAMVYRAKADLQLPPALYSRGIYPTRDQKVEAERFLAEMREHYQEKLETRRWGGSWLRTM